MTNTQSKHTATHYKAPLAVDGFCLTDIIKEVNKDAYVHIARVNYADDSSIDTVNEDIATAQRMVLAYNCHDELVEALKFISSELSETWMENDMSKPENKKLAHLINKTKTICEQALKKAGE